MEGEKHRNNQRQTHKQQSGSGFAPFRMGLVYDHAHQNVTDAVKQAANQHHCPYVSSADSDAVRILQHQEGGGQSPNDIDAHITETVKDFFQSRTGQRIFHFIL